MPRRTTSAAPCATLVCRTRADDAATKANADRSHKWPAVARHACIPGTVLRHPNWQSPFDQFPDQAVKIRRQIYDRLAGERVPVQAFHHPFPGRSVIEEDEHGYRRIALGEDVSRAL